MIKCHSILNVVSSWNEYYDTDLFYHEKYQLVINNKMPAKKIEFEFERTRV